MSQAEDQHKCPTQRTNTNEPRRGPTHMPHAEDQHKCPTQRTNRNGPRRGPTQMHHAEDQRSCSHTLELSCAHALMLSCHAFPEGEAACCRVRCQLLLSCSDALVLSCSQALVLPRSLTRKHTIPHHLASRSCSYRFSPGLNSIVNMHGLRPRSAIHDYGIVTIVRKIQWRRHHLQ